MFLKILHFSSKKIEITKFISQAGLETNPGIQAFPLTAQYMFEYIHYLGLPWWGAILAGSLLVRLIVFPLQVKTIKMAAENAPHMAKYQESMVEYSQQVQEAAGDTEKLQALSQEQFKKNLEFYKEHNPFRQMYPTFLQFPVYLSVFIGLERMCYNNEAFQALLREGGAAWFTDLTVRDPYFLIPLGCAVTSYLLFRSVVQTQKENSAVVSPVFLILARVMPILSFGFAAIFPSGLSMYFLGTGICAYFSTRLLQSPPMRKLVGLPPLQKRPPAPPQQPPPMWNNPTKATDSEQTVFKEKE